MPRTTPTTATRRTTSADDCGHLYLLRFDNGVIKAGRSSNPRQRRSHHRTAAARFNLTVTTEWYSDELDYLRGEERRLLAVLATIGTRTPAGREYFYGIPFSVARYQAERLRYLKHDGCCRTDCVEPAQVRTTAYIHGEPREDPIDTTRLVLDIRLPCEAVIPASFEDAFEPDENERLRRGDTFNIELDPKPWQERWMAWLL